ncbi:procathepsin L-like [Daphnia carinata]|uniref:procathepsin L-like n=1 Tax=Daphnia carinata TaxID=120202 RepID=UPI00257B3A49|nr:procathepsin L-like [Daphnia carinata]
MRCCYVFLLIVVVCTTIASSEFKPNPDVDERWERFKVKFRKTYANDAEELKRRKIWEKNIANIDKHNEEFKEGKHSYTLAENKYADMTKEEWKNHFKGKRPSKKPKRKIA